MSLVSKGSCIFNLTLGYDLTKAKNITLSGSGESWGCLPSLGASQNIILSSSLIPTELISPHLLKCTSQNAMVGIKGWRLRKGLRCFSHGLSKRRDIFLNFLAMSTVTCDLEHPESTEASHLLGKLTQGGWHSSLFIPHTPTQYRYLPAFLASWHWPQLQRLPLGPLNGLCKQAGWLLGQIVYFVYSGTIPSRHV